jgi:hypothetical protein
MKTADSERRGSQQRKRLRSFAGWWYFATTGAHVGFESWLERSPDADGL